MDSKVRAILRMFQGTHPGRSSVTSLSPSIQILKWYSAERPMPLALSGPFLPSLSPLNSVWCPESSLLGLLCRAGCGFQLEVDAVWRSPQTGHSLTGKVTLGRPCHPVLLQAELTARLMVCTEQLMSITRSVSHFL